MATTPEMDDLIAAVAAENGVIESAITLLLGLVPLIEAAAGNKAATLALAAEVRTKTQALADAVAAVPPA